MNYVLALRHLGVLLICVLFALAVCAQVPAVKANGTTASGAMYELQKPLVWNGSLVVYAHGIVAPQAPLHVPGQDVEGQHDGFYYIAQSLLARNVAVATTSYSTNGFAVKEGGQDVHQLRALFTSKFGAPRHTYLMGHSLGGLITVMLAETYPTQYSGALAMCGVNSGSLNEIKYAGDARVLYDSIFGNMPPLFGATSNTLPPDWQNVVIGSLATQPAKTLTFINDANVLGFPLTPADFMSNPLGAIAGGTEIVGFTVVYTPDIVARTHGHLPYSTTDWTHSVPNAETYNSTPDAVNYLAQYYTPTGDLRIPMVTLHTTIDPVVPFWHETLYAQAVAAKGNSTFLAPGYVQAFDHCTFTLSQQLKAFDNLVNWVEKNQPPTDTDYTAY